MRAAPLLAVAAALVLAVPATAEALQPARLLVVGNEFSLVLSRPSVKAGPIIIQLVNSGEDEHDLKLRRNGGTRVHSLRPALPGEHSTLGTRLRAGTFRLWCSIADHRARGMRATLIVRGR